MAFTNEVVKQYCSIQDVKQYLNIKDANIDSTAMNAFLSLCIEEVSSEMNCICNQYLGTVDVNVEFNGTGTYDYFLQNSPVNKVNYIKYKSNSPQESYITIDSSQYELQKIGPTSIGNIRYFEKYNPKFHYIANINYGYDPIPRKIREIAIEGVAKMYKESSLMGEGWLGKSSVSETIQGISHSTTYKDMVKEWESRLLTWTLQAI